MSDAADQDPEDLTAAERDVRHWYRGARDELAPSIASDRAILAAAAGRGAVTRSRSRFVLPGIGLALTAALAVFVVVQAPVPGGPELPNGSAAPMRSAGDTARIARPNAVTRPAPATPAGAPGDSPAGAFKARAPRAMDAEIIPPKAPAAAAVARSDAFAARARLAGDAGVGAPATGPRMPILPVAKRAGARQEARADETDRQFQPQVLRDTLDMTALPAAQSVEREVGAAAPSAPAAVPGMSANRARAASAAPVPAPAPMPSSLPAAPAGRGAAPGLLLHGRANDASALEKKAVERTAPSNTPSNATGNAPSNAPSKATAPPAIVAQPATAADVQLQADLARLVHLLQRNDPSLPAAVARFRKRYPDFDLGAAVPALGHRVPARE